ncbi:RPM1 interacting protein 4 [Hibiscus trionum]|uniref:RPM1 interacting protein 4 n=1 Tax=Hibiscus trionum TaxID=183268 RepID=A0A9W7LLX4_HIBTR|nr:RPM1 interacting protein 4 [Hibiscus trionum]
MRMVKRYRWRRSTQRSRVPKFGTWENERDVPYTAYFDKARQGRSGGKIVNPNDPQESPEVHRDYVAPIRAPPESDEPVGHGPARRGHERGRSREEGDLKQYGDSPARNENVNRRPSGDYAPSRYGRGVSSGDPPKRSTRASIGSENSIDKSPLHHQARSTGRGSMASPAWEGKASHESSHGTPGRSRMRPSARGNESPDIGAAVPKFGDWDESNPSSADGYTHIFNQVREERNNGGRVTPGDRSPYNTSRNRKPTNSGGKCCCFPFWRK